MENERIAAATSLHNMAMCHCEAAKARPRRDPFDNTKGHLNKPMYEERWTITPKNGARDADED